MFGWLLGKKEVVAIADVPEMATEGQPVHVNLPAEAKQKIVRHLTRIMKCMAVLDQSPAPANAIEFIDEIKMRRAQLTLQGIDAPETCAEIDTMIREM